MFARNTLASLVALNLTAVPAWAETRSEGENTEEVVVTATLSARDSATSPAFTSVIGREDIERVPVNSLADLLRDTVGVNNRTDPTGRDEIQIRGMSGRYTLILVDGKRVSSAGALWRGGDFDLSSIPMGSIERVEIVRGPMAALYGSDAIGGVVNIVTKAPSQEWHGRIAAEYRQIEAGAEGAQQRYNASAAGAISDRVSLSVSGEIYERDPWYRYSASDPQEVPALEEKQSASLVSTARIELNDTQSLDVDLGYDNDERPYNLYSYVFYPAWDYESYDYREQEITRASYGLAHNADWGWGKSTVYLKREDSEIDDFNSSYDDPQQRTLNETNTYFKAYATSVLGVHGLTAGIDFRDQLIEDPVTYLETGEVGTSNSGLFVQDEIAFTDTFNLTLGGRYDDHEVFGGNFSPKIYATYAIADGVVFKAGASEAFKAPDAYQMSEEYSVISCGGNCYLSGDPDLDPETSINYEAGIDVRRPGWRLTAALFHNDVDDMIVAVYDPVAVAREWINVASAKTRGLELDGRVDLSDALAVSANLTYMDTEARDADGVETDLDNRPEILANLAFNWRVSDSFDASLSTNHVGEQYYEGESLPAYTRVDLTASYAAAPSVALNFGVKNVTDVDLQDENENFIIRELGRNYYLSANYSF